MSNASAELQDVLVVGLNVWKSRAEKRVWFSEIAGHDVKMSGDTNRDTGVARLPGATSNFLLWHASHKRTVRRAV